MDLADSLFTDGDLIAVRATPKYRAVTSQDSFAKPSNPKSGRHAREARRSNSGLDTFGDVTVDKDGKLLSQAQVLRNVVEEGVLADQVGIDFIGVGEHHRDDFAVSAPDVVLAAIASRTKRIHLGSAVTVLSSDDPIRVFQRFSTLDALSNGRAEVILGRGSFTESFPLFGYSLNDYERLFSEKLDLFADAPEAGAGQLERLGPAGTEGPDRLSAGRERHAEDLDRRRRQPGIGGARGATTTCR